MMKISDIEKRINASYNTIKRFIEKNPEYNEKVDNVLHATDLGLEQLELEYGVKSEILSDDNINFYKGQILLLREQVEDHKKFSEVFTKQIEMRDTEVEENKNRIRELEEKLQQNEIEKLELKHELELEKNKSIWKKLFKKGK
ncbi:MAG TPA: hypothetical protein VFC60_03335 [Tissierellaceae bacterium]|nr:hypothetical protein [Tissierellaceae bacterium]